MCIIVSLTKKEQLKMDLSSLTLLPATQKELLSVNPLPQYIMDKISTTYALSIRTLATAAVAGVAFTISPYLSLPIAALAVVFTVLTVKSHLDANKDKDRRAKAFGELNQSLTQTRGLNLNLVTGWDYKNSITYRLDKNDLTPLQKFQLILQDLKNLDLVELLTKYNIPPSGSRSGVTLVELSKDESYVDEIRQIIFEKFSSFLSIDHDEWQKEYSALNKVLMKDLFIQTPEGGLITLEDVLRPIKEAFAQAVFRGMYEESDFEMFSKNEFLQVSGFPRTLGKGVLGYIPESGEIHDFVARNILQWFLDRKESLSAETVRERLEEYTNLSSEDIDLIVQALREKKLDQLAKEFEEDKLTFKRNEDNWIHPKDIIAQFPDLLKLSEKYPEKYPRMKQILVAEYDIAKAYPKLEGVFEALAKNGLTPEKIEELRKELVAQ